MHLLIDVRTSSLSDIVHLYYAEIWATAWAKYHPHDMLTFLAYEGDPVQYENTIFLEKKWSPFGKKLASHPYGPDRIISFSRLPTIDTSIPTILHVYDLRDDLYTTQTNTIFGGYFGNKGGRPFEQARAIIVPSKEIAHQLSELYNISEGKMTIIPYIEESDSEREAHTSFLPLGITKEYYIAECTPGEEWRPIEILQSFSRYSHDEKGSKKLILLGDLGENLGMISTLIRSLDIIDSVKIAGILTQEERDIIYKNASGWIYIGHYYSRGGSVALAHTYDIPLYLSSIDGLHGYTSMTLHANHIDVLPEVLGKPYKPHKIITKPDTKMILEAYARIIAG